MNHRISSGFSRRTIITGAAAGFVVAVGGANVAEAANASPIPTLPYETSRTATRTTRLGKKKYEAIDIAVAGDVARIFVPWTAPPFTKTGQGVVWFYHSNGSDYTALDGAYKYGAELAIDKGAICVCPSYGGNLWTNTQSIKFQTNASTYMSSVWTIGASFARANSGGGPLMTYAYGKRLVPAQRGMYLANAAYDMEDLYARDPDRIGPPYNYNLAAVQATNPARLPQSAWKGVRLKAVMSQLDFLVPPAQHGEALVAKARPVAADVQVRYHAEGHVVPSWTQTDMISTFAGWL